MEVKNIRYWRFTRSIGELEDMVKNRELVLSSDFLSKELRSLFIEGIMLNFPMPKIETLSIERNVSKVIAGNDKLNTAIAFIDGKFKLDGVLDEKFKGMSYSDTLTHRIGFHIKRNSLIVGEISSASTENYSEEVLTDYCKKILDKY